MKVYPLTSIIIPSYNGLSLLKRCVDSIRAYTDVPYEIIVVDNGSSDGTDEYCQEQQLIMVRLPENRGFPVACNKGLAVASGEQLLLFNNDCMATPRWLPQLLTALTSREEIGIVGPVTNYASGRQQIEGVIGGAEQWLHYAEQHNATDPARWIEVRRLIGFCFLFTRKFYEQIGPLDEGFSPGHYEDDDYCMRAVRKGKKLLICGDTFVYHEGSASFKQHAADEWKKLIERNRKRYIDKWGCDPLQFI